MSEKTPQSTGFITHSAEETRGLGKALACLLRPGDVVLLDGELGAGKTCFAQGVAHGLGIAQQVTSPTFTLMREYKGIMPLYHLDLYRLDGPADLRGIGVEEYLDSEGVLLVEWGDRAREFFGEERLEIAFFFGAGEDDRSVVFTPRGASWRQRSLAALPGGIVHGDG